MKKYLAITFFLLVASFAVAPQTSALVGDPCDNGAATCIEGGNINADQCQAVCKERSRYFSCFNRGTRPDRYRCYCADTIDDLEGSCTRWASSDGRLGDVQASGYGEQQCSNDCTVAKYEKYCFDPEGGIPTSVANTDTTQRISEHCSAIPTLMMVQVRHQPKHS